MNGPRLVSASQAQLDELLQLAKTKTTFSPEHYALLEEVLSTFVYVMLALQNAKTSIKRFRQMLFGARTENKRKLLKAGSAGDALEAATSPSQASSAADATSAPPTPPATPAEGSKPAKPPPPGHGRISAQAYSNAPVVELAVDGLRSGDPCPECEVGKVYDSAPKVVVRVVGQPPLDATVYKQRRLRCRLCDAMFTAVLPDGVGPSKYDHSCASGWRQLPWPVDDNYPGRLKADAGQVREAGFSVCASKTHRRRTGCPARELRTTKCTSTRKIANG